MHQALRDRHFALGVAKIGAERRDFAAGDTDIAGKRVGGCGDGAAADDGVERRTLLLLRKTLQGLDRNQTVMLHAGHQAGFAG